MYGVGWMCVCVCVCVFLFYITICKFNDKLMDAMSENSFIITCSPWTLPCNLTFDQLLLHTPVCTQCSLLHVTHCTTTCPQCDKACPPPLSSTQKPLFSFPFSLAHRLKHDAAAMPPPAEDRAEKQAAAQQAVDILHEISTILVCHPSSNRDDVA